MIKIPILDNCGICRGIMPTNAFALYFSISGGGGTSSGSTDTSMARRGTSSVTSERLLPNSVSNLVDSLTGVTAQTGTPNLLRLKELVDASDNVTGYNVTKDIAARNPYNNNYIEDTQASYEQLLKDNLALAVTGDQNVLAPITRGKSLREAEVLRRGAADRAKEVREAQVQDANIQNQATQTVTANQINAAQATNAGGSEIARTLLSLGDLIGQNKSTTIEDIVGKGSQTTSASSQSIQAGTNMCCWIFMEAYEGKMPWWVRACRDQFAPEDSSRRNGYRRMSKWLVPTMRKSRIVRNLVKYSMIKPLTVWGGWLWGVPGYQRGRHFRCIVNFWFKVWTFLGKLPSFRNSSTLN